MCFVIVACFILLGTESSLGESKMCKEGFNELLKGDHNMHNLLLELHLHLFWMCFQVDMGLKLK